MSGTGSPLLELYSPTQRIKLRTPTAEEDEITSIFRVDPATLRYLKFLPTIMTPEEARQRRESRSKNETILDLNVFVKLPDGSYECCGSTGVFNIDNLQKTCEAGILISGKYQGQGLTAEIFYTLWSYIFEERGFYRVNLETSILNAPMRGWLEKVAGARHEATRREAWTDGAGGRTDVCSYAILEWEWRETIKPRLEKRILTRGSA